MIFFPLSKGVKNNGNAKCNNILGGVRLTHAGNYVVQSTSLVTSTLAVHGNRNNFKMMLNTKMYQLINPETPLTTIER